MLQIVFNSRQQENGTSRSSRQSGHRNRANPAARHPHVKKSRNSRLRQGFGEARRSATREGGLFDQPRQPLSVAQVRRLRPERLEVVAHQLVQGALLGSTRLIGG